MKKHGLYKHPLYNTYINIRGRTGNPKHRDYHYYGDRGITMQEEWKEDPQAFFDWAYANGYKKGLDLDRIDNNKGYVIGNLRFISHYLNNLNRRDIQRNNKTGYRGVSLTDNGKFRANITVKGKRKHIGVFDTPEEAAKARDTYIIKKKLEKLYRKQYNEKAAAAYAGSILANYLKQLRRF